MTNLPMINLSAMAEGTGMEDNPMLYTAYQMLQDGQHPLAVQEKIRNLGGDADLDALVSLRNKMQIDLNDIYPVDVITDPLNTFHKAFALQRQRLSKLLEREASGEDISRSSIDAAILALQDSASKLADLMYTLGYRPYAKQDERKDGGSIPLAFIISADKDQLKDFISKPTDIVDGEVKLIE